jgi:hypothetical protein
MRAVQLFLLGILIISVGLGFNYLTLSWVWGLEVKSWTAFFVMAIVNSIYAKALADLGSQINEISRRTRNNNNGE